MWLLALREQLLHLKNILVSYKNLKKKLNDLAIGGVPLVSLIKANPCPTAVYVLYIVTHDAQYTLFPHAIRSFL